MWFNKKHKLNWRALHIFVSGCKVMAKREMSAARISKKFTLSFNIDIIHDFVYYLLKVIAQNF